MNNRLVRAAAAALTLPALLAACGTTEADDAEPSAAASCQDDAKVSTEPVTLTDAFGRTVELDKPAERVAVLEWQQIEDVLTLCATPVAVADAKGYATWNTAEELPEGVTDVGTRGEPNLDALYGADPDLIIVEAYTAEDEIIKQLEKQDVPVLATKGADAKDPLKQMFATFELIAEATGREERAEDVREEVEASLEQGTEKIADAELATDEFVYLDGWVQGGNVTLRPFGQGALIAEVGEELGLKNAWTGEVDPAYGLGQTDIEGLTAAGDATILYSGTIDPATESFIEPMKQNPIWTKLPAVQDDRAHAFPAGIWTFGGPRSVQQMVDAYVDVLTD